MTKEMGRASIRQACGQKGLPLKLPMRLQARSSPERSCGLCTGQPEGEEPSSQGRWSHMDSKWPHLGGLARRQLAEKPPEAEALAEPRKSASHTLSHADLATSAAERPSTKPAAGPTRDFSKMGC